MNAPGLAVSSVAMVGVGLIVIQAAFNVLVTRRVLSSNFYDTAQKRIQIVIVWLIPVLGVALVWLFLQHERPHKLAELEIEDDDVEESLFSSRPASPGVSHVSSPSDDNPA